MQDQKTSQQLIREYEANLPPEIMGLIQSFDWKKEVRAIVNQNQLMIDVGGDIEESIYLILLDIITAQDFFERLVQIHDIPEDKAQKIIEEAETQIFNPMYKKIIELDVPEQTEPDKSEILAEIEKEPEPLIKLNFSPKKEESESIVTMSQSIIKEEKNNSGIVQPFTISPSKTIEVEPQKLEAPEPVITTEAKPIETVLTNPTITQAPKPYSADPYREPIE